LAYCATYPVIVPRSPDPHPSEVKSNELGGQTSTRLDATLLDATHKNILKPAALAAA
jgi:hypothetical protein